MSGGKRTIDVEPDWLVSDPSGEGGAAIPPLGTVLAGVYEVTDVIGRGGMGVVLRARDRILERDVAIKLIDPGYGLTAHARERFLTEARTMAAVRHEAVVQVYAFAEHEGVPFFVMEHVPGKSVAEWLEDFSEDDPPPVDEVLGIVDQVCRGVSAIHRAGIVHGDLKPGNVLLGPAFRAAVADFGLVRLLESAHEMPQVVGTPAYIAPEIVLSPRQDPRLAPRADVYALAAMTYELFTGYVPFDVDTVSELMVVAARAAPPVPPSELREDLPTAFDDILLAGLLHDPRRRTPDPDTFRRGLLEARDQLRRTEPPMRVIVADDDRDFLELARETLQYALPTAEIEAVLDGQAALAAFDREPATLAVIDLDMPGLNGVELTAALRAHAHGAHAAIIVVTAFGGAPDWRLLQALGADGFLVKPIDPFALVAVARRTAGVTTSEPPRSR